MRLLARIVLVLISIPAALLSGWWWHRQGHRAALALMDFDHRWFHIKDVHRSRLPARRNPWLDPPEVQKDHSASK